MIVDTHVHYLQPPSPERPYAPDGNVMDVHSVDEMLALSEAAGVYRIVQVTPSTMGYDNRYGIEGAAAHPDRVMGVFGRFDPFAPDLEGRFAAFMEAPAMLGARIQLRPGAVADGWLHERKLDPFLAVAERQGVRVAIMMPDRARELQALARRFPALRLLAEHTTLTTEISDEAWSAGWPGLIALAAEPNVWLKVSLFPESAPAGEPFPFPTSQARLRALYEAVGAQKLIWGSNFPPVSRRCTYRQAFDFMRLACADFTPRDREAILGANFLVAFARH